MAEEKKQEFMQSSMGYTCCECKKTFLIGWRNVITRRPTCDECVKGTGIPEAEEVLFIELVY